VIFEKLVDDEASISLGRILVNLVAKCTFMDINRNLSTMMGAGKFPFKNYSL